jgi:DME family drug/metabolite transporter
VQQIFMFKLHCAYTKIHIAGSERLTLQTEKPRLGYGLAILAAFLLSTVGILGKEAFKLGVDPLTITSLRTTIAALIVVVVFMSTDRRTFRIEARDLPLFIVFGVIGISVGNLTYFYSLEVTTVAISTTLLYTYPALVVIFALFVYQEPVTRTKVIALAVTFLGTVLTAFNSLHLTFAPGFRGLTFGLLSGGATAVYTLAGKRAQEKYGIKTALLYSFLFGALALDAIRLGMLGTGFNLDPRSIFIIFVLATVPTLLGYGALIGSLRFIEAGKSSIATSISPAIAIYLAYLLLSEIPGSVQLLGSALAILGVMVLQTRKPRSTAH